jgi:hypothetical protein
MIDGLVFLILISSIKFKIDNKKYKNNFNPSFNNSLLLCSQSN